MLRSKIIADRLREVFLDGEWVANTNYQEQLLHVSLDQATQKLGTLNTIGALTYHVNYYLNGLLKVFKGGELEIKDKFSFDAPPLLSEMDWKNLINDFMKNSEEFAQKVEQMSDEIFDEIFVDEKYGTYQRNIEGIIEHAYYHLGQITLIRKMIA